jgi:hypothetical protein
VAADVFRPQSAGRALRTAFVLGVLIVIALVAALEAVHQFNSLVGDNTKDELSRYLDDNAHTTAKPGGAGFRVDFPVPASRGSERFATAAGTITAPRDHAVVDDEVTFDAVWLELPGALPTNANKTLGGLVNLQLRQLGGTRIGASGARTLGHAIGRDVAFVTVDQIGAKHYYDERILLDGRRVWVLRVASRVRRDAAFSKFAASFAFTK